MAWFCKFKDDLCNRCYLFDMTDPSQVSRTTKTIWIGLQFYSKPITSFSTSGKLRHKSTFLITSTGSSTGLYILLKVLPSTADQGSCSPSACYDFFDHLHKKIVFWVIRLTWRVFCVTSRVIWIINRAFKVISLMSCIFSMFFVFSKLTPFSPVRDAGFHNLEL